MEKIKIATRVFVDGTSIENMSESRMANLFAKSGYILTTKTEQTNITKISTGVKYENTLRKIRRTSSTIENRRT